MLRFYREFVIKALTVLLWARDRANLGDCYSYVRTRRDGYGGIVDERLLGDLLDAIPFNGDQIEGSVDEMATELVQQLSQIRVDSDLIDTMVSILGLPHAASVLSGRTLEALRKAILLPDEIAGLKARLAEQELHCSNCGRPFVSNEMLCVVRNSSGSPFLYCAACRLPSFRACNNCKTADKVALSNATLKGLMKTCTCETCKINLAAGDSPQPGQQGSGAADRSALYTIPPTRRGNRRNTIPTAATPVADSYRTWASRFTSGGIRLDGAPTFAPSTAAPAQGITITGFSVDELSPFELDDMTLVETPRSGG